MPFLLHFFLVGRVPLLNRQQEKEYQLILTSLLEDLEEFRGLGKMLLMNQRVLHQMCSSSNAGAGSCPRIVKSRVSFL